MLSSLNEQLFTKQPYYITSLRFEIIGQKLKWCFGVKESNIIAIRVATKIRVVMKCGRFISKYYWRNADIPLWYGDKFIGNAGQMRLLATFKQ